MRTSRRPLLLIVVLTLALLAAIGYGVYATFRGFDSYLQSTDEIYIMEAGMLKHCLPLRDGEEIAITYDMAHPSYAELLSTYPIAEIAGEGSELERALRLMDEYAPRLRHQSDYDNHVTMEALPLLAYSLDNRGHGINCRSKAQILNEMCLALGIPARKVWLMPSSMYDTDCHVVNEVWDTALQKWVMLDITNNQYWVDENGTPLSILEIREKGATNEFCTPVAPGDSLSDLPKLKQRYIGDFIYIMKNMVYLEAFDTYTVGESEDIYLLFPENLRTTYDLFMSPASFEAAPV